MIETWFLSDPHFGHTNMCVGLSNWNNKEINCRKFLTVEEMNNLIIENINKFVGFDDILYTLGDWSFGGIENIWKFRKRIHCKNIFLIPGNHDHHIKINRTLPNCQWGHHYDGFEDWLPTEDEPTLEDDPVRAQDLFKMLPELVKVKIKKQTFILCHFPLEEWEDMDKGSIHLHGHCHGKLNHCEINTTYKRMDVGIDWEEFRPYSLEEIIKIMDNRPLKQHVS